MKRRTFLRGGATTSFLVIAGCSSSTNGNTTTTEEETIEKNGEEYIFLDETGTLGHLGTENPPENSEDWRTIQNTLEEDDWREKQRNDVQFTKEALTEMEEPNAGGLDTTAEQLIQDTKQIYENPVENLQTGISQKLGINLEEEHNEITFTRALVRASQEAGIDSSGLSDDIISNLAEHALTQMPGTNFTDYKLSTVYTATALDPLTSGYVSETRTVEETGDEWGNSGFRHPAAILQYEKNGETHLKYVEQIDAIRSSNFRYSIRDPEDSLYHASLNQDRVSTVPLDKMDAETPAEAGTGNIRFPEHFGSPLAYRKARELEKQDLLGLGETRSDNYTAVGDYLTSAIVSLVDDVGIEGYNKNPDVDIDEPRTGEGGSLVSHEFGDSVEAYIQNPDTETRQQLENIGRGICQIRQQTQKDWETPIALTGTIQDPEIRATTQETVNQVRKDQAYDEVRERIT